MPAEYVSRRTHSLRKAREDQRPLRVRGTHRNTARTTALSGATVNVMPMLKRPLTGRALRFNAVAEERTPVPALALVTRRHVGRIGRVFARANRCKPASMSRK